MNRAVSRSSCSIATGRRGRLRASCIGRRVLADFARKSDSYPDVDKRNLFRDVNGWVLRAPNLSIQIRSTDMC